MKDNERDYLARLFSSTSDAEDQVQVDFPLVDVPKELSARLHKVTEAQPQVETSVARPRFISWPKVSAIAASLLAITVGFQFYQQQQTLNQLAQAQADLKVALHYLGEANRITRTQVRNSVRESMQKAAVQPAIELGKETVLPSLKSLESEQKLESHSL